MDLVDKDENDSHEAADPFCESQAAELEPPWLQEEANHSVETLW